MSMPMIVHQRWCAASRDTPLWARSLLAISGSLFALMGSHPCGGRRIRHLGRVDLLHARGLGLIASGTLLARRHVAGAWAYMAVYAATVLWSLHDVGLGGSSLLYRLMGPLVMLFMIGALLPALCNWSRSRTIGICAA
ncbi:hypothetical protein OVY48_06265 [Sphingobium sp. SA2]|uniref:hypothetical protein n=1 Tax=Sphingobium sp. SA2 TaxID=1524832 RepID=UPI0028C08728|nr:hypothetical protein [Sphingobium sp. SA2]MDT7533041.1 hypothetical protein [Sphingobium sp. SA2]